MQIGKDMVVSIDYTLTGDDGAVIDSSDGGEPLAYIHGQGSIIAGLESALEGRAAGDLFQLAIPPEHGYGEYDDGLRQIVPLDKFGDASRVLVGARFRANSEAGPRLFTVMAIEKGQVLADGNHPLAGQTLHFDVKVREVRAATPEELEHGHAHGPGGHHS